MKEMRCRFNVAHFFVKYVIIGTYMWVNYGENKKKGGK